MTTRLGDWCARWWRLLLLPPLLALVWLLGAPSARQVSSLELGGPHLATSTAATPASAARTTPAVRHVVVHVAGAVRRPGVYRVRAPGRLIDAVRRAGGLLPGADLTQINLAARLTDGRAIIVPGGAGGGASPGTTGAASPGPGAGIKLNLNAATAEQLDQLDGVGPAMAAAIIQQRTKLGGFTSLDQLDAVSGVGERRLASLREQLEL